MTIIIIIILPLCSCYHLQCFSRSLENCGLICGMAHSFSMVSSCQERKETQLHNVKTVLSHIPLPEPFTELNTAFLPLRKQSIFIFNSAAHFSVSTSNSANQLVTLSAADSWVTLLRIYFREFETFPLSDLLILVKHEKMSYEI